MQLQINNDRKSFNKNFTDIFFIIFDQKVRRKLKFYTWKTIDSILKLRKVLYKVKKYFVYLFSTTAFNTNSLIHKNKRNIHNENKISLFLVK